MLGSVEAFRARWIAPSQRRELLGRLPEAGRSALLVRQLEEMTRVHLDLWYAVPPMKGGRHHGAFTVH
jgi:hypothetical protein